MSGVATLLAELGLDKYAEKFAANEIDFDALPHLTEDDLRELGLPVGPRRKLLAAIRELRASPQLKSASALSAAPSEPQGERRQVTVLFADLVGYSNLSRERDPEEVHALLERFFACVDLIVEKYGGVVDKHIGDCVMGVFGAPVAHGNDAERAVRAALAVRDTMAALSAEVGRAVEVHIGVAGGQVMASGIGGARRREYTVTGESVNLAARLTDAARAGQILVSDRVWQMLAEQFEGADVGTLDIQGFAAPVRTWRLERISSRSYRQPLVGRRVELGQFRAVLTACRETGRGCTVCVRGEAGIGKTRLLEAFRTAAAEHDFACHTALVLDFAAGTGRDAIGALVRDILGIRLASDADAALATAEAAFAGGLVAREDAVFLYDLLGLPQPLDLRAVYDAMDNVARNHGKWQTMIHLAERASRKQPRLLAVEDLHWADPLTLACLAELAGTVANCSAILVMTSRLEEDPLSPAWSAMAAGRPWLGIDLGPLHADEARALAAQFPTADAAVAERCVERAAGNPLFLEQLLRHAEEGADASVPGSVQNLVQARLDRLVPADKAALQAASVLGQRVDRRALAQLLDDSGYAPERLTAHFMMRPHGEGFLFAHALIRDAIYESLLKSRRRELHRRAATSFAHTDPVLYAEHLDRAEDGGAARAYLCAAQSQALAHKFESACALAERGHVLADDPEAQYELACLRGELCREVGAIDVSLEAFQDALRIVGDGDAREAKAWIGLAAGARIAERYEEALQHLDRAEAIAFRHGLAESLAEIYYHRASLHFRLGNIEDCLRQSELALDQALRAASPAHEARARSVLGDAYYMRGRIITAHGHYCRCLEVAREHGYGRIEIANLHMRGLTRYYQNDLSGALEDASVAARTADRTGHLRAEMIARGVCGGVLLDMDDRGAAQGHFERALALAHRLGALSYEPFSLVGLGKLRWAEGNHHEAVRLIEQAVSLSREVGIKTSGPRALGALALVTDDLVVRRQALNDGEAILRGGCISHHYFSFYRDAMEACLRNEDWEGAERYAANLESYTRAEPVPLADFFVARGRALAAAGRGKRDFSLLETLTRLRQDADRLGHRLALPAIDAVLAGNTIP